MDPTYQCFICNESFNITLFDATFSLKKFVACIYYATHTPPFHYDIDHSSQAAPRAILLCANDACTKAATDRLKIEAAQWSRSRYNNALEEFQVSDAEAKEFRDRLKLQYPFPWMSFPSQPPLNHFPGLNQMDAPLPAHGPVEGMVIPTSVNTITDADIDQWDTSTFTSSSGPTQAEDPFAIGVAEHAISRSSSTCSLPESKSSEVQRPTIQIVVLFWFDEEWIVELDSEGDLLTRDAYHLLHSNHSALMPNLDSSLQLFGATKNIIDAKASNSSSASSSSQHKHPSTKVYRVGELNVLLLHLLCQLHFLQQKGVVGQDLLISFVPWQAISKDLAKHLPTSSPIIEESLASSSASSIREKSTRLWNQLSFKDVDKAASFSSLLPASIKVRICSKIEDTYNGVPVQMVLLNSLMYYYRLSPHTELKVAFNSWLKYLDGKTGGKVSVFPPLEWEEKTEFKNEIYRQLSEVMIKTQWVNVKRDANGDIKKLANLLIDGKPDGHYVIKGAFSCAGESIKFIHISNQKCDGLVSAVTELVQVLCQEDIGIQDKIPGFTKNEFRHFCVATVHPTSHLKLFVHAFTVRTTWNEDENLTAGLKAELCAPLHEDTLAAHLLVQELIKPDGVHREFFNNLLEVGIPMIRIDCGYDSVKRQAFLSEFAQSPDAITWTKTHCHDLIYHNACSLAGSMSKQLRI